MIWQSHFPLSDPLLRPIATAPSLTAILSTLGTFSVQLEQLGNTSDYPLFADFRLPEPMFTRKVTLFLGETPVVHAQSVCAPSSHWRAILDCGTTPLGAILFSGSLNIQRSEIQFAHDTDKLCAYLLARRSWFDWRGERLYLAECFLPSLRDYVSS